MKTTIESITRSSPKRYSVIMADPPWDVHQKVRTERVDTTN